ncbi:hypothetical protein [Kocuria sp. cx-455]|uniref:hypothetical protein n=1 Tax=Kocuria sp. cx-455 TaxID=2771377 RepID=UPI003D756027
MILYSSFTHAPMHDFQGYCFVNADYVYGPRGAHARYDNTGEAIGPGHDGCYVTVRPVGNTWEFGVDALGMAKLFVYEEGGVWAISSSLATLVDHLREHGVRLRPNYPQLAGLAVNKRLTSQMSSFRTIFEGVRLVSSSDVVLLHRDKIQTRPVQRAARPQTYKAGLSSFLELWLSRLVGILKDGRAHLECDLSGGIDSRTVFAIVMASALRVDGAWDRIDFRSNANNEADFNVAQEIAKTYHVSLNSPGPRENARLRKGRRPVSWRDTCMGNYLLPYFHKVGSHPFAMHCHGSGGEVHRSAYAGASAEKLAKENESAMPAHLYGVWHDDFLETIDALTAQDPSMDPMQLHFREFRNRLHFGHRPHGSVVLSMLNSAALNFMADYPEAMNTRQLYFDIMENLMPGLANIRYDLDKKSPSSENLQNVTHVDSSCLSNIGNVYAQAEWESGMSVNSRPYLLADFLIDARSALAHKGVRSFVLPEDLISARAALEQCEVSGKLGHPNSIETKKLVYCVFVHWVLEA